MTRLAMQSLSEMSIEVRQRRAQLKAEVLHHRPPRSGKVGARAEGQGRQDGHAAYEPKLPSGGRQAHLGRRERGVMASADRTEVVEYRVAGNRADGSRFRGIPVSAPLGFIREMAERSRRRGCTNVHIEWRTATRFSESPWVDVGAGGEGE